MAKPLAITLESAARLIGGNDSRLLNAVDRLLGLAILVSPVVLGPSSIAVLTLLEPKNELVRLTRDLLGAARSQAVGRQGASRTELLLAAHTIAVLAAFFEAVEAELGELYSQLELTDDEKAILAMAAARRPEDDSHADPRTFARMEVPGPSGRRDFEDTHAAFHHFYLDLSMQLHAFIAGLAVWERWNGRLQSMVVRALQERVPHRAVSIYHDAYLNLAIQFHEFFVWTNFQEHSATRQLLTEQLEAKVHEPLTRLREVLQEQQSVDRDSALHVYEGPAYSRSAYRNEAGSFLGFYNEVFVGRETELSRIVEFAAKAQTGYLLVQAPPGYGKTALVAQLIRHHENDAWVNPSPNLIYYFIREEGGRHSPASFATAISSQLLDLLGERGGVPADLESQRSQLLWLWKRAVRASGSRKPLLLIVDGLDEMLLDEVTIADLLPGELGPYVHVLVTSRAYPEPLTQVPPDHPFRYPMDVLSLHTLTEADIGSLLQAFGIATESRTALVKRIQELTHGEPLLTRFVSQDVASYGESILARLEQDPPKGTREYFQRQFKQLELRAEGDTTWRILGILLVAHGPMSVGDLASALQLSSRRVRQAIEPIRRYLIGDKQLELMHLELRAVVNEHLSRAEQQGYRRQLLDWCMSFADAGWPDDTPDYILLHCAEHLRKAGRSDELYALVDRRWMDLKSTRTRSLHGFSQDIAQAIDVARLENPPNISQQVRGSLVLMTVRALATKVPQQALRVLSIMGHFARVESYASLIGDAEQRFDAYLELSKALFSRGRTREGEVAADRALGAALAIRDYKHREPDRALAHLACDLAEVGAVDKALTVIRRISMQTAHPYAFAVVAEGLASSGQGDRAMELIHTARDDVNEPYALACISRGLVAAGQDQHAWAVAESALVAAKHVGSGKKRFETLISVAEVLSGTRYARQAIEQAVLTVSAMEGDERKPFMVKDIAKALAREGLAEQALTVAGLLKEDGFRAHALADVTTLLVKSGQVEKAKDAAVQARAVVNKVESWGEARRVALALAQVGLADEALMVALSIRPGTERSTVDKAEALADVALVLAKAGHELQASKAADEAVAVVQGRLDYQGALERFDYVALALARAGLAEHVRRVADLARAARPNPQGDWFETLELERLARALAEVGSVEDALETALSLQSDQGRSTVLAGVAEVLATTGYTQQAESAVEQVLAAVQSDGEYEGKAYMVAAVAEALAKTGLAELSLNVVQLIREDHHKAQVLVRMAEAFAEGGWTEPTKVAAEEALATARRRQDDRGSDDDVIAGAAQALASAGYADQALLALRAIRMDWRQAQALADVAKILADAGMKEEANKAAEGALAAAHRHDSLEIKRYPFTDIIRAFVKTGQNEQAIKLAEQLLATTPNLRVVEAKLVYWILIEAFPNVQGQQGDRRGVISRIITLARARKNNDARVDLLDEVVWSLVGSGWLDEALAAAEAIDDSGAKADKFLRIAEALSAAGRGEEAGHVVEQALAAEQAVAAEKAIHEGESEPVSVSIDGQTEAEAILDQVLDDKQKVFEYGRRAARLARVAAALVKVGQAQHVRLVVELALVAMHTLRYDEDSGRTELADALAKAGLVNEAIAVCQTRSMDLGKPRALGELAGTLAESGYAEAAEIAANAALKAAHALQHQGYVSNTIAHYFAELAPILAKAGHTKQAMVAAEQALAAVPFAEPSTFSDVVGSLAQTLLKTNRRQQLSALGEYILEVEQWSAAR